MAKIRTDKSGNRYISHDDVLADEMSNPAFRTAFTQRRYVQEIARAVRAMRQAAGLSQGELASMVGMKQPAIARLETSQGTTPQWRTLDRIAFALGKQLTLNLGDVDTTKPLVRVRTSGRRRSSAPQAHDAK